MQINWFIALCILFFSCQTKHNQETTNDVTISENASIQPLDTVTKQEKEEPKPQDKNLADTSFVNIKDYSDHFAYDMRYATDNNFLKEKVYDCDHCLMRYEVAKALIKANDSLNQLGYKIKFFDCFRPVDVQMKMWEIYPDARYVANPHKTGSVHNKGAALDITLVELNNTEVDMGTDFDHFGKEAHHTYEALPDKVLNNRKVLKSVMQAFGFNPIRTEWWHYNFGKNSSYKISDYPLCDEG